MDNKNHELYLEEIETAVAETTKELLTKQSSSLRVMAKLVAEKQVEINRLKEYYSNDRKTIRNLRQLLKEATEENEVIMLQGIHKILEKDKEIDLLKEDLKDYKELSIAQSKSQASLTEQTTKLKAEIDLLKEELDVGGMMNFSKYNDNDPN